MKKSATFTQIIVRIGYIALAATAVLFPYSVVLSNFDAVNYIDSRLLTIPFYFVVPAGYVALISIDLIMSQIKKGNVFNGKIVKYLTALVGACIYAGVVGVVAFVVAHFKDAFMPYTLILSFAEFFMALICYVLKHCFVAGEKIKDENDLTI